MSYETNPKKSNKAKRVRNPLPVLGVLPRGKGISNYTPPVTWCKEEGCVLPRVSCSSRCVNHTGKANTNLTNNLN